MRKNILSLSLVLTLVCSLFAVNVSAASIFSDVDGHWAQATIDELAGKGIINGKGGGIYDPEGSVTRAEFMKLLIATENAEPNAALGELSDVTDDAWYNPYVYAGLDKKVFSLVELEGGCFMPEASADRETVALWAVRLLELESETTVTTFADDEYISNKNAVAAAYENGIITGDEGTNTFRPKDNLTRAEAAVIIKRVMDKSTGITGNTDNPPAISIPASSGERPTRPVTTTVTLADGNISIKGSGATAADNILSITADGVYEISGTLSSGQILIDAPKDAKVELVLSGVNITAGENAAIYCKNADELIITLAENTRNTLTDTSEFIYADIVNEEPNATLYCDTDMNIGGSGSLTVNAGFAHGILVKDDLVVDGGSYTVTAAEDGVRGKDSITVLSGNFDVTAGGDGFKSNNADSAEVGRIVFEDGTYNITAKGDAVQAESTLTVNGGNFDIITEGTPTGTSDSQKGLKCVTLLKITDGEFNIITKDDGIHSNTDVQIDGGSIYIETKDDGIHADRNLYINGGEINIPTCYEGFEGTIIEVNGGKSFISASNDAVSAAAGTPEAEAWSGRGGNPHVQAWFNGGELEAVANADVVDSNGNIYVTGSTLRLSSPARPDYEGALLCNGDVTISGGNIAVVGCMGVNVYTEEQPVLWVSHARELPNGAVLSLRDKNGNTLSEITTRKSAVQSAYTSPELQPGESYTLYIDGEKKIEITLKNGMNTIGDDGGEFTGGYSRGTW